MKSEELIYLTRLYRWGHNIRVVPQMEPLEKVQSFIYSMKVGINIIVANKKRKISIFDKENPAVERRRDRYLGEQLENLLDE